MSVLVDPSARLPLLSSAVLNSVILYTLMATRYCINDFLMIIALGK